MTSDRHDVVDDDRRGQEHAQLDGDAVAEQHDQRDREGRVGPDRNAPSVPQFRRCDRCIDDRRQDDAAQRGDHRKRPRSKGRQVADGELALDLEPDDEEEDRQEPVVDPVEQRMRERARAPLESQGRFPPRRECRAEGRVAEHQREHRRQPQEQSRRRPPANELERGGLDAMAERAEHRVGQRAFIPGARIAAAVDEESRRHPRAAALRALDVLAHPRLRRRECGLVRSRRSAAG